jgi:hypothetical protein
MSTFDSSNFWNENMHLYIVNLLYNNEKCQYFLITQMGVFCFAQIYTVAVLCVIFVGSRFLIILF